MLELKNIWKTYPAGSGVVEALRGVDLTFRESEFVSILGPSGCGKTTLLNIIGGLDQYDRGDLTIHGVSTKEFQDRDWDSYRNHSVGFVFQSYHLIPHQTVLQNVELALTLSGVSKHQRRKQAIAALESVGLADQLHKRPSQLSGGQMQRVAIARALVNNPDIILADEPTGALDSETSVQIMELLKTIAKDRLVVMVTHNPELAQAYSTRIIQMLDGKLKEDSHPVEAVPQGQESKREPKKQKKKPSMKWTTAFGLSLKNLVAKRSRTTLTSFAGSIGIIGIALIYAVSQGMTTYIQVVQEDTLSSYPLTIESSTVELGSLMSTFMEAADSGEDHPLDGVYSKSMVYDLVNALNSAETTENDLQAFDRYIKQQLEQTDSALSQAISGINYGYDLQLQVYTKNVDGEVILSDAQALLQDMMRKHLQTDISAMMGLGNRMNPMMGAASYSVWQQMLPGKDGRPVNELLQKQYDVIYGSWPNSYDEIVLVVDENNELDDMALYALGLKSTEEMDAIMDAAANGTTLDVPMDSWSYEEICDMVFRVVLPSDCFIPDETTGLYTDMRDTDAGLRYLYDNAITLRVSGIIRPNPDAISTMLSGAIGYTADLTEHVITQSADAKVVAAQKDSPNLDVLSGLPFRPESGQMTDSQKAEYFRDYLSGLDTKETAKTYVAIHALLEPEELASMVEQNMAGLTLEDMQNMLLQGISGQMNVDKKEMERYVLEMEQEELEELISQMMEKQISETYAQQVRTQMQAMGEEALAVALQREKDSYPEEACARYYDAVLTFSESDYESNLVQMGCLDLSDPAVMHFFATSFESKDVITQAIADYNAQVEEIKQIQYTDYVGLMMSSVTTIVNAVTYVLIAFVAISLVVSSIMIGVITLISVQERTKEIGILRAIGASKRNVSSMFNAETILIGTASGVLGVGLTYLLCIPINMVIQTLTGIPNLRAYLPWTTAVVLIGISILLSVFAGLIPARSAARKDPVVALRTE